MLSRRLFIGGGVAATSAVMRPDAAHAMMSQRPSSEHYAILGRLVETYMAERHIAGAVFAIGRHNHRADFMAWGYSALSHGQFLNEESLFRIYSMTKPVTAAAAMMLIAEGRMALDQNIADFLPGFAQPRVIVDAAKGLESRPARRPITIRNLLTHTAGLTYANDRGGGGPVERAYQALGLVTGQRNIADDVPRAPSLAAFAERLATVPLIADPGTRWRYSIGLDLMGAVIERATEQPFEAFLKERIFDPLDMDDTGFQVPAHSLPRLVANYLATPAGLQPFDIPPHTIYAHKPAFPYGGSGLVSSARDYSRFTAMLLGEGNYAGKQVMAPEAVRLMMSNLLPEGVPAPGNQGYGAGGYVLMKPSHTGQGVGTYGWAGVGGTLMWVDPFYKVHATFLSQYMPIDALPVQYAVPRAVYEDLSKQT